MPSKEAPYGQLPMDVAVEIRSAGHPTRIFHTAQLHSGGLLLLSTDDLRPAVGAELFIQLVGTLGCGDTPPIVKARVLLHVQGGFTVQFED